MALFDTNSGLGGLLGDFSDYGFGVPKNTGLVADPEREAINKRALLSGLISAGLTYAATPKNLNTGSAIPYLGKAGLAGFNTSQDVVDRALNTAYRNKLIAGRDDIFSNINPLDVTPESLQIYVQGGKKDPSVLRRAAPVEKLPPTRTIKRGRQEVFQELQTDGTYKDYSTSSLDAPKEPKAANEMYEQKPTVDANGQTVYLPTVYGAQKKLPVLDIQGRPVTNYAPTRTKPLLPPAIQKAEDEDYEKISSANTIVRSTGDIINSFATGKIPTSVIGKTGAYLASATGINANDPNVIAYKDYDRFKTKLVNESLRLNKGTQTEGDAVRAVRELNSAASPQDAISALTQLQWYNSQAIENASKNVLRRRTNSGLPAPEVMPEKPDIQALQIPAGVDGITIVKRLPAKFLEKAPVQLPSTSIKDAKLIYDALPKNARYVDIDTTTGQPIRNADGTFRIAVKQ